MPVRCCRPRPTQVDHEGGKSGFSRAEEPGPGDFETSFSPGRAHVRRVAGQNVAIYEAGRPETRCISIRDASSFHLAACWNRSRSKCPPSSRLMRARTFLLKLAVTPAESS